MMLNLPAEFLTEINKKNRKPIQLCEFYLPEGVFYLSDRNLGIVDGLLNDYLPWVESWGTLSDNTFINNLYEGGSLEIRTCTITLLVSPTSRTFIKKLFQSGIENTSVKYYQWFPGLSTQPVLIDVFVCQDPISNTEASMLLSIDLVSPLMKSNPYLWPEAAGNEKQPVVIGKATGLPLKDLQSSRVTELSQDMTFNQTGSIFIENGIGFAASGVVSIDSEDMAYSSISASAIVISARARNGTTARPHYRGALISPYGAIYDYVICSGPVQSVNNLLGNGEAYLNNVTFFPGQNPVVARFVGRPPWLKVSPGAGGQDIIPAPVTNTEFGNAIEENYGNGASGSTSPGAINAIAGNAVMAISQNTGGGPGSFTKYGQYDFQNNLGVNNYTKFYGSTGTVNQLNADCGIFGNLVDSVIGSIDDQYGWNDSSYGNITAITVSVPFNSIGDVVLAAHIKLRVILVLAGGSTAVLQEWEVNALNTVYPGTPAPWRNQTFTYTISISDFSILQGAKIRIEAESIHAKTLTEYSTYSTRLRASWLQVRWNISYFTPIGSISNPYQELVSKFNRNLSSLGAIINVTAKLYFASVLSNAQATIKIVKRSTSNIGDDVSLWSSSVAANLSGLEYSFSLGSMSWNDLSNLRIGVSHQITGPNTEGITRAITTSFSYVKWEIQYQPGAIETPDEERIVYADSLTCDVVSLLGENPTPPKVIEFLIDNYSESGQYIDDGNFLINHDKYVLDNYYLNGVLDAGIQLHDALKQVLFEGACRLLFNQGKIKLISYFDEQNEVIDLEISTDDIQLRSRKTDNQPTERIKNDITISYDKDYYLDVFDGQENVIDDYSVAKFSRKDYRVELQLVNSQSVSQIFANRLLDLLSKPKAIYSFNMFFKAYILEKGDRVSAKTFLDNRFLSVGNVLSVQRIFGQGKNNQINLFKISIANPKSFANLELFDTIKVNDSFVKLQKGFEFPKETILIDDSNFSTSREYTLQERLLITEQLFLDLCKREGYGSCSYGLLPYGV